MESYYREYGGRGKDALMQRNLRMCTEEGLFATPWSIIAVPGNVFIAALLVGVLGLSESFYGWLVSLPAWANALQMLLMPMLSRRISARNLTVGFSLLNVLAWAILVATLHKLPVDNPQLLGLSLLGFFLVSSLSMSLAAVGWMSWIQEWIPERIRGKYFGRRNRLMGTVSVSFILFATYAFDQWGETIHAFQILLGICVFLRLLSVYLVTHIYTPWSKPETMLHVGVFERFREVWQHKGFRHYLQFAILLAFGMSMTGAFAPVYMAEYLGFPVGKQTVLLLLASLSSALGMPLWGLLCDRHGSRSVIFTTGVLWMLQNYLWAVLTPQWSVALYGMWLWGGFMSGGVILGGFNIVLKLTPTGLKSSAISLHLACTSLAAAVAPILIGYYLSDPFGWFGDGVVRYRILFLVQPTLVILSLLMLLRVDEPKSADLSSFSGAFRAMRTIMVQSGSLLFANVTLFSRRDKKPAEDGLG